MDNQLLLSLILEELNGTPLRNLKDWKVFIKIHNQLTKKLNISPYEEVNFDHNFKELLQTI